MLALLTAACNSNDDNPPVPLQYRISWIHSEDSYQLYEYDNEGRIAKWEYNEPGPDLTVSCSSSFTYPADGTSIAIVAEETRGDMALDFNETLHLNADGTASRAEGTVLLKRGDSLMRKNYTAAFEYNHLHQLTEIEITEKRVDTATGSEETYPLEWAISLEWSENNLTGYSEYTDPEYPAVTKAYTYFGGAVPYHMPVVQGPILRAYYLPLQYQGILIPRPPSRLCILLQRRCLSQQFLCGKLLYNAGRQGDRIHHRLGHQEKQQSLERPQPLTLIIRRGRSVWRATIAAEESCSPGRTNVSGIPEQSSEP